MVANGLLVPGQKFFFDAWGNTLSPVGAPTPLTTLLYTGEQRDASTGMYYLRARYYNPLLSRFTSVDSWSEKYNSIADFNGYRYTANDPINSRDPLGLFKMSDLLSANGIKALMHSIKSATLALVKKKVVPALFPTGVQKYLFGWTWREVLFTAGIRANINLGINGLIGHYYINEVLPTFINQAYSLWTVLRTRADEKISSEVFGLIIDAERQQKEHIDNIQTGFWTVGQLGIGISFGMGFYSAYQKGRLYNTYLEMKERLLQYSGIDVSFQPDIWSLTKGVFSRSLEVEESMMRVREMILAHDRGETDQVMSHGLALLQILRQYGTIKVNSVNGQTSGAYVDMLQRAADGEVLPGIF